MLKLQYFGYLMSLEKTLMLGKTEGRRRRGRQRMRWLDGITYSMDMGLANSRRYWREPGMLLSMASQRAGKDWATEQQLDTCGQWHTQISYKLSVFVDRDWTVYINKSMENLINLRYHSIYIKCYSRYMGTWASQVAQWLEKPPADARDVGLIPGSRISPGGGRGNPPQYSCLENPMDRGASGATVHGVARSWTWQSHWAHTHILNYS